MGQWEECKRWEDVCANTADPLCCALVKTNNLQTKYIYICIYIYNNIVPDQIQSLGPAALP